MPDELKAEKYGFEPFGTLAGVLSGAPIKLMPVGKFYRDERVLDITESDLKEIELNVAAGLPRFRIPINENHQTGGKIGTVKSVKYMPNGPDGQGLYADVYELTQAGKQLLKDGRYDALSPEMVWTKNGATYQDPQTGKRLDNILVGVAICDRPFFSHDHVALFSAMPPDPAMPKRHNGYTKLRAMMKSKFDELMAMVKDDDGDGEMDMPEHEGMTTQSVPSNFGAPATNIHANATTMTTTTTGTWVPLGKSATIPVAGAADTQPAAKAANDQGVTTMADEKMVETFSAEEFAAYKVQAEAEKKELAEKFAALELRSRGVERARRHDQLLARAERFVAIPVAALELADKFQALEEKDAELYKWVDGLLETLDKQIAQADLFGQKASARSGGQVEKFDGVVAKIHADKFGGDPAKYAEAMDEAARLHPALYTEYASTYSTRRKGE